MFVIYLSQQKRTEKYYRKEDRNMSNTERTKTLNLSDIVQVTGGSFSPPKKKPPHPIKEEDIIWQVTDNKTGVLIKSIDSDF